MIKNDLYCQKTDQNKENIAKEVYRYRKKIRIPKEWKGKTSTLDYRKLIKIPEEWKEKRIRLEYKGIYKTVEVFVNGTLVSKNSCNYSDFYVILNMWLQYGTENEIEIIADNPGRLDIGIDVVAAEK